jgi:4-hydroxy-2-oxoglutarate aldolase
MTTPFDKNGDVDARAIRSNISRWMSAGLGGVVALGSNGEAALLDDHEADVVLDAARAAVPRDKVLIAGTARESTRATIAASRRAAAAGADAVLVRTPSAFKARMTADALARHYTAVADASPIPVLLYNYPAATGVNLAVETVARLAEHPNIAGMKETGTDVAQLAAFVDATPERFAVMAGSAPPVYAFLCVGGIGAILAVACAAPDACVRLYDLTIAGRHADARELQRRLTPLGKMVTTGFGVPGLKAAMDLAGYVGGDPRAPLVSAGADAVAQIRAELDRLQKAGDIHFLTRQ